MPPGDRDLASQPERVLLYFIYGAILGTVVAGLLIVVVRTRLGGQSAYGRAGDAATYRYSLTAA